MPLKTVEPQRLYRQIAEQLRGLIAKGEFPPGARLPAERELAQQLGVSRPSVREALIALEVEGLVEVRMGSGIYVREQPAPAAPAAAVSAEPPLETIRAREVIECELAARAATSMKAAQLRGLREAIRLMQHEAAQGQLPTQGDRLFHVRIVEASGNPVLHGVDTEGYHRYANAHDLVVLAIGMQPETEGMTLPEDIVRDSSGFLEGSVSGGQFGAGAAAAPLDVNRAVQSATAAALRGIQVIHRSKGAEATHG